MTCVSNEALHVCGCALYGAVASPHMVVGNPHPTSKGAWRCCGDALLDGVLLKAWVMFEAILQKIPQHLSGVRACFLLDIQDALPIATYAVEDDLEVSELLAVELVDVARHFRARQAITSEWGTLQDLCVRSSKAALWGRQVGDGLMLLIVLAPDADLARGPVLLRLLSPRIEAQL